MRRCLGKPHFDFRVQLDHALIEGQIGFLQAGEDHALALHLGLFDRDEVAAHYRILRGAHDRPPVAGSKDVVGAHHQRMRFHLSLERQRQVHGHLVTVEVGVEALAHQGMQVDCIAFDQDRLKGLDAHAVQSGSTIQQHRMVLDNLLQDIPDLFVLALQHLLGGLDRVRVPQVFQLADDEGLVQFQCDLLGQATLVQTQSGTDHDHASRRIIDTFTQQVFAETSLLTLDHIGQGLERTIAAAQHGTLAAIVVEQGVNGLLQHPLFVADDDFRCIQVDQLAQAIVAIDDPAVQIIQVAGRKVTAVQAAPRDADREESPESHPEPSIRDDCRCHESTRPT